MDRIKKKKTFKETTIIDKKTGEVLNSELKKITYTSEPYYVKLYIDDLTKILGLSGTANSTLLALIRKMNWDGEVVITKQMKKDVADRLKLKINTIEHAITDLVSENIFIKKGINYYLVNPNYFARGDWADIRSIRMTISYDENGRAIQKTIFDGQQVLDI